MISEGMVERILAKGVPPAKVHLIPNFVDLTEFVPGEKRNPFSLEHGLQDQLVVLYAGNMGKPQGLDVLIEAAARLKDEPGIRFVMMGTGSERQALEEQARALKLPNVLFLGQQPYSSMGRCACHGKHLLCQSGSTHRVGRYSFEGLPHSWKWSPHPGQHVIGFRPGPDRPRRQGWRDRTSGKSGSHRGSLEAGTDRTGRMGTDGNARTRIRERSLLATHDLGEVSPFAVAVGRCRIQQAMTLGKITARPVDLRRSLAGPVCSLRGS